MKEAVVCSIVARTEAFVCSILARTEAFVCSILASNLLLEAAEEAVNYSNCSINAIIRVSNAVIGPSVTCELLLTLIMYVA